MRHSLEHSNFYLLYYVNIKIHDGETNILVNTIHLFYHSSKLTNHSLVVAVYFHFAWEKKKKSDFQMAHGYFCILYGKLPADNYDITATVYVLCYEYLALTFKRLLLLHSFLLHLSLLSPSFASLILS